MIIWRGRGYLVPVIVFICSLLFNIATDKITKDINYYNNNSWLIGFSLWFAAAFIWVLVKYLPTEKNVKAMDIETGEHFIIDNSNKDALFFINIKYWPLILCVIGLAVIGSYFI